MEVPDRLARAESTYRRASAIKEKALGRTHPDPAATLNNLALLWHETGRPDLAGPAYRRYLALLPPGDHPLRRACTHNLDRMLAESTR